MGTPNAFALGGQQAWYHDEGFASGYFHTYDALAVAPAGAAHKVNVFLPRGYEADKAKSYPVVYMNDGTTAFFPGGPANKSWRAADALAILYGCGAVDEVIVVAVWPVNRNQEYTHAPWKTGAECCGVAAYGDYLAGPLKGFIDGQYRTRPGREFTTLVGSSHGGLAAFHVAATHGAVFGRAVAMSSSFWAGLDSGLENPGGALASSALLDATKAGLGSAALRPRLWLDWGLVRDGGAHNSVTEALATSRGREMRDLLIGGHGYALGSSLSFVEDPDGAHDEDSWARRLPLALRAALAP
ncbi:MAG: alpha/beta hydrolase [Myxococcales bacterium]|nr:MAG: alpha/beta hydrolase [Myxococcales bacterium]